MVLAFQGKAPKHDAGPRRVLRFLGELGFRALYKPRFGFFASAAVRSVCRALEADAAREVMNSSGGQFSCQLPKDVSRGFRCPGVRVECLDLA